MSGEDIFRRARDALDSPFRLHGRNVATGLDCVGLVAHAAALNDLPCDYAMRGWHGPRIAKTLQAAGFDARADALSAGDIILFGAGPRQSHLAVMGYETFIHAHAGLRRVVETPLPLPWPLRGHWRLSGD